MNKSASDATTARPAPLWHAEDVPAVLSALHSDWQGGLSDAQIEAARAQYGPNALPRATATPAWKRLLLQFHNPLIYVLLAAGATTVLLGDWIDASVIFGVVLINAAVGFVQEGKAERALNAVHHMLAAKANVVRSGLRAQIDAQDLVPGDIVLLESGDKVPADIRLLQIRNLRVMEAALTGESLPSEKAFASQSPQAALADRVNMAYSGTLVTSGQARGVVVATGTSTELGKIGTMVNQLQLVTTPLMAKLDRFARAISAFIVGVGVLALIYGHWVMHMPMMDIFLAVVGLSVAAIPEGLPAIVTIVLAIGTRVMAKNRAVIRRLPAVETLGSVSVICSDKTGTLTKNEMTAVRVVLQDLDLEVRGSGYAPTGDFYLAKAPVTATQLPALQALAHCAVLCNDAQLQEQADRQWLLHGDPTEGALLALGLKTGLDLVALQTSHPRLDAIPFESEHRFMATLHATPEGERQILLKGAPERVLPLCVGRTGQALDIAQWHQAIERAAQSGERVLALAQCRTTEHINSIEHAHIQPCFELLGLVGIIDPPREEAIAAVAECQRAGITVKMITGDHGATAASIGARLGLRAERYLIGEDIEAMDDLALRNAAQEVDIIARASPAHKLRLVAALQAAGHLVAMTGDGVNDAPALKAANIGVAMGGKGTDAAREASDLVLTDDNFSTITQAVRQGRVVFDNIKKSLLFILPTNGGQASVMLLAIALGWALPMTAAQILWVNMITAVTMALALAFEPPERGVMRRAPRLANEPLLTGALIQRIALMSVLMAATTFAAFQWTLEGGADLSTARTAAVNAMIVAEWFYLFNARHFTQSALRLETFTGNAMVWWVSAALAAAQALFVYWPPFQRVFDTQPLGARTWGQILLMGAATFVVIELEKRWRRKRKQQSQF